MVTEVELSMKKGLSISLMFLLVIHFFPDSSSVSDIRNEERRADEIVIKGISIVNATNVSVDEAPGGVIATGTWNIFVEYKLSQNMDLWVLYNISRVDSWGYDRTNFTLGNVGRGEDIACNNGTFNFVAGEYWIHVTIGNQSDPSINTTTATLFHFEDISVVEVTDVGISGFTDTMNGYYANESHEIFIITGNMGNQNLTQKTWITLNITNTTNSDIFLEIFIIEWIDVGDMVVNFTNWVPEYSALYTVNVTYSNEGLNANASMYYDEFEVTIQNVSAYSFILAYTDSVNESTAWAGNATVDVTNEGNLVESFTFHFWIVDDAGIIVHDRELTSILLSPSMSDMLTYHYVYLAIGTYTLNVTEPDGTNVSGIIVVENPCLPAILRDLTKLPTTVYEDDVLTFTVNYTDTNNNGPVYLKCYIDATWNFTSKMFEDGLANFTLTEVNASDTDYTDAKMYSGTWVSVAGDHTYAFAASDGMEVSKLEPVDDFTVYPIPSTCYISGTVSTGAGTDIEYISDANVVLYKTTITQETDGDNIINVTTFDYFNTSTDANGNYTKTLDFGIFTIYVTKTGYQDSAEYEFELTVDNYEVVKDFSLTPITTGRLNVTVKNETNASLSGFVVQVFFKDSGECFMNKLTWNGCTSFEPPAGDYFVKVRGRIYDGIDYTYWLGMVTVKLNETTDLLVVMKPHLLPTPWTKVIGNITDNMNISLEGVEVAIYNYTTISIGNDSTAIENHTDVLWIDNDTVRVKEFYKSLLSDVNGSFDIFLKEGSYNFTFTKVGYRTQTRRVAVNGSEPIALTIIMEEMKHHTFPVFVGPILDENGMPLSGVIVTFEYKGVTYTATTGEDGIATFDDFPIDAIPQGTDYSAARGDEGYTWAEGDPLPEFEVDEAREGSLLWLWAIIIIIIGIGVAVVMYLIKLKNGEEGESVKSEDEVFKGELDVFTEDNEDENPLPNYDNRHY